MTRTRLTSTEMECLRKLSTAYTTNVNHVKLHKNNTPEHEMAKARVCYELLKQDHCFVTEARFKNGNRADVYDITTDEVWEVETNIKPETKAEKTKQYPVAWVFIIDPAKPVPAQM